MKTELIIDTEELRREIVNDVVQALTPLLKEGRGEDDCLMDIEACAEYLGVKVQWLYKRAHHHKIPFAKVGKLLRFKKSKIDCWVQENSTPQINPLSTKLKAVK